MRGLGHGRSTSGRGSGPCRRSSTCRGRSSPCACRWRGSARSATPGSSRSPGSRCRRRARRRARPEPPPGAASRSAPPHRLQEIHHDPPLPSPRERQPGHAAQRGRAAAHAAKGGEDRGVSPEADAEARSVTRRRAVVLAVLFVGLAFCTVIQAIGWNQASHYALIRAIDRRTAKIDLYKYSTGDKARYHGHWYSARAPGLAFIAQPAYEPMVRLGLPNHERKRIAGRYNSEIVWLLTIWAA